MEKKKGIYSSLGINREEQSLSRGRSKSEKKGKYSCGEDFGDHLPLTKEKGSVRVKRDFPFLRVKKNPPTERGKLVLRGGETSPGRNCALRGGFAPKESLGKASPQRPLRRSGSSNREKKKIIEEGPDCGSSSRGVEAERGGKRPAVLVKAIRRGKKKKVPLKGRGRKSSYVQLLHKGDHTKGSQRRGKKRPDERKGGKGGGEAI